LTLQQPPVAPPFGGYCASPFAPSRSLIDTTGAAMLMTDDYRLFLCILLEHAHDML